MKKLIAMRENLGLGHKGNILITTQEQINKNESPIANNIIDESYANEICNRYNAFEEDGFVTNLLTACEMAENWLLAISKREGGLVLMAQACPYPADNHTRRKIQNAIAIAKAKTE